MSQKVYTFDPETRVFTGVLEVNHIRPANSTRVPVPASLPAQGSAWCWRGRWVLDARPTNEEV